MPFSWTWPIGSTRWLINRKNLLLLPHIGDQIDVLSLAFSRASSMLTERRIRGEDEDLSWWTGLRCGRVSPQRGIKKCGIGETLESICARSDAALFIAAQYMPPVLGFADQQMVEMVDTVVLRLCLPSPTGTSRMVTPGSRNVSTT